MMRKLVSYRLADDLQQALRALNLAVNRFILVADVQMVH